MTTDWTLKLQAFLHDPFEKPLILFSERHAVRAGELAALLGLSRPTSAMREKIKTADHYASAMNRLVVESAQAKHPVDFLRHPLVIHPLSGEEFDLGGSFSAMDDEGSNRVVQNAKTAVEETLGELYARYDQDPQRLFLALWRLMPEKLRQARGQNEALGHLWTLLPADSRVPDHSIWDHLATTSAMVTALDQPTFLLFTLGPVQEFIATARRTQDLWMGSFLLSYLTWQGMRVVAERFGPDCLMFPSLFAQPLVDHWIRDRHQIEIPKRTSEDLGQASFPNRFLALVPAGNAHELAEEARTALLAKWRDIAQRVKAHVETSLADAALGADATWNSLWTAHIEACFETFWVALPWGTDYQTIIEQYKSYLGIHGEMPFERVIAHFKQQRETYLNPGTLYARLYDLTERALGSRKTLRGYQATIEVGYKCTLCGVREALHPTTSHRYRDVGRFWERLASVFPSDFRTEGRERLCAVCVTKRLAVDAYFGPELEMDHAAFPSTSTIAVESFRAEVLQKCNAVREELDALATAFRDWPRSIKPRRARPVAKVQRLARQRQEDLMPLVQMDGRWLFGESYEEQALAQEYGDEVSTAEEAQEAFKTARTKLQKLLKRTKAHNIAPPSTYYAIVYMDGDRMGEWLSGEHEHVPTIERVLHPRVREALQRDWQEIMNDPRPLAPSLHTAVSSALRAFSQEVVRPIVEFHCGMLVYAGGDDVIAFFPIRHALAAVWDLRRLYAGDACEAGDSGERERFRASRGFVKHGQDLWMMMGGKATASAGIAIAHHLQPLSQALDAARQAESMAKSLLGRNAFAVHVLKRSGERLLAGAQFSYNSGIAPIDTLQRVIKALRGEEVATLSSRLMYQLAREGILGTLESNAVGAQEAELSRLLNRHIEPKDDNHAACAAFTAELGSALTHLLRAMRQTHQDIAKSADPGVRTPFDLFINLLLLCRFIAMEGRV